MKNDWRHTVRPTQSHQGDINVTRLGYIYYLYILDDPWWRNMETFSSLLTLCTGNPTINSGFPLQRVTNDAEVCCFLRGWIEQLLNKWFEMPHICMVFLTCSHNWGWFTIYLVGNYCHRKDKNTNSWLHIVLKALFRAWYDLKLQLSHYIWVVPERRFLQGCK